MYTDRSPTNGQLRGMTQEEAKNINKALFFLSGGDERQAMITHKMEKENKDKNNYKKNRKKTNKLSLRRAKSD